MEDSGKGLGSFSTVDSVNIAELESNIHNHSGQICQELVSNYKFCKPRILPLKTFTVEILEKLQKEAEERLKNLSDK